jgi:hypothetical protein
MASDPTGPQRPPPAGVMPPPRDPDIAVRDEFEHARAANSAAALELFIRRHADHSLAEEARRLLESRRKSGGR